MNEARLDAVWAAVYVRVLSAIPPSFPTADHGINAVAEMLADPASTRIKIAVKAADNAVLRLVEELVNATEVSS